MNTLLRSNDALSLAIKTLIFCLGLLFCANLVHADTAATPAVSDTATRTVAGRISSLGCDSALWQFSDAVRSSDGTRERSCLATLCIQQSDSTFRIKTFFIEGSFHGALAGDSICCQVLLRTGYLSNLLFLGRNGCDLRSGR